MAVSARSSKHEIGALLRAHLSAATRYRRHLTRHCPICHRLLKLAWERGAEVTDGPSVRPVSTGSRGTASQ